MKTFLLVIVVMALSSSCYSQILNSNNQIILAHTKFISVYEFDRNSHDCLDKKNIPIIFSNKIVPCFKFKKKLGTQSIQQIIKILSNKSSLQKPDPTCFTSDFGMILFDNQHKMIGSITTSFNCNNLSFDNTAPIKLTRRAKKCLLKIIR